VKNNQSTLKSYGFEVLLRYNLRLDLEINASEALYIFRKCKLPSSYLSGDDVGSHVHGPGTGHQLR
jgi:hypothetical protein